MTAVQSRRTAAVATARGITGSLAFILALAGLATLATRHADAQELEPNDFIPLPPGSSRKLRDDK